MAAGGWDERYRSGEVPDEPAAFLVEHVDVVPQGARVLDVAGGAGRNAVWLAKRGCDVTLVDASSVGLELAVAAAEGSGVRLRLVHADLTSTPLPRGPFDLVLIHHFLDRDVLAQVPDVLAPAGVLLFCQPTVDNLQHHDRPPRRFLLERGEMAHIAERLGLEVIELTEGWTAEGRHEARLVARAQPSD
jgi:tellurite methyltransferase